MRNNLKDMLNANPPDWKGLAAFPSTDTERQYLFGMFETTSRIVSIARKIAAKDKRFKRNSWESSDGLDKYDKLYR